VTKFKRHIVKQNDEEKYVMWSFIIFTDLILLVKRRWMR